MIYHPRIAGAHTIEKIGDDFSFYRFLRSSQAHNGLPQLNTELRQSCNTPGHSIATHTAISSLTLHQAPRVASLGEEWGKHLREVGKWYKAAITATYSSFSLCPSDPWVSHFLPYFLFHLTISPVCLLYHSVTISVYLCFCLSLCFPFHFLIPPHSTYPSCVIRRGLPDPVHINQ